MFVWTWFGRLEASDADAVAILDDERRQLTAVEVARFGRFLVNGCSICCRTSSGSFPVLPLRDDGVSGEIKKKTDIVSLGILGMLYA